MTIGTSQVDTMPIGRLELYWVPLGAGTTVGSHVVRLSGPSTSGLSPQSNAVRRGRCFTPRSSPEREDRGVVGGGAVGSRLLGRSRIFCYEIRRWVDGVIPDIGSAVDSPVVISTDADEVAQVLDLLPHVPSEVWGRDHARTGEMWNSNSVVSWTLARRAR